MSIIDQIIQWDVQLFLLLNSIHHPAVDGVMNLITHKATWIPFYAVLAYLFYRVYHKKIGIILVFCIALIFMSDQGSGLIKKNFKRKRPCHNEIISASVHVTSGCGGSFGFVSSHAANSFALAVFLTLLIHKKKRYKWLPMILFSWAALVTYSRIYVGVHYPLDLWVGALIGSMLGYLYYLLIMKTKIGYE